jgi:hypothetical protein
MYWIWWSWMVVVNKPFVVSRPNDEKVDLLFGRQHIVARFKLALEVDFRWSASSGRGKGDDPDGEWSTEGIGLTCMDQSRDIGRP